MKILGLITGIKGYDQPTVDKAAEKKAEAKQESTSQQDKISLSQEGKLLQEAQKAAADSPDVRQEKIENLKAEIQKGNYQLDSTKIAQKLVEQDIELLS